MNAQLNLLIQQWDSNVVRLRPIRTHDILQRQDTLGKGKLRSPVGGTIYANVIWPGMKWKYASRSSAVSPQVNQAVTPAVGCHYVVSFNWFRPAHMAIIFLTRYSTEAGIQLKRCVHKLSKSQKFEKIVSEVVDMPTAKIQLNSGLTKYILYRSA